MRRHFATWCWMLFTLLTTVAGRHQYIGSEEDVRVTYENDDDSVPLAVLQRQSERQDMGIVYGVTGRDFLVRAMLSAFYFETASIHFYVGSENECAQGLLNASWACVDVRTTKTFEVVRERTFPPFSFSRIVKIIAIIEAPCSLCFFVDSDALPCSPIDTIVDMFHTHGRDRLSSNSRLPLYEHYDVMLAMARGAMKKDPRKEWRQYGRPPIFGTLNSGFIVYRNDRTNVHTLWRHWLHRYCSHDHHKVTESIMDQPDLMLALYDAIADHNLQLYVLGPQWNMKKWRDEYFTGIGPSCCPENAGVQIDHGCKLNQHQRHTFAHLRHHLKNATGVRWIAE